MRKLVIAMVLAASVLAGPAVAQDCSSATVTPTGFSTPRSIPGPSGHQATLHLTAPNACHWTVVSNSSFLTVLPPASGFGSAQVNVDVAPNPGDARAGSVMVRIGSNIPREFHMVQRGCLSVLTDPAYNDIFPGYWRHRFIDGAGGRRLVKANPESVNCIWSARSHVNWIRVSQGGTGAGPGIVTFDVDPSPPGSGDRAGTFQVGHLVFTVHQWERTFGDLNGDDHPDLLWHHRTTGRIATWLVRQDRLVEGHLLDPPQVADTAWKVVAAGDIGSGQLGDALPDLVWQHDDGRVAVWWMNGRTRISGTVISSDTADPGWRVRAIGDLNSDGHQDLIWQHRPSGEVRAWIMIGGYRAFTATFSIPQVPDIDWQIVGAGDFTRDGQSDLIWQHAASGLIAVWVLDWSARGDWNTQWRVADGRLLNPEQVSDTSWRIRGVSDIDRDGQPDLLWQNESNGLIATWLMDGTSLRDGRLFSPAQVADTNWVLVGPR